MGNLDGISGLMNLVTYLGKFLVNYAPMTSVKGWDYAQNQIRNDYGAATYEY